MKNVMMMFGILSSALFIPTAPAAAHTASDSVAECAAQARSFANSVAEPNTSEWMEEFVSYVEILCADYFNRDSGGIGSGRNGIEELCRRFAECNVTYPTRLPGN